MKRILSRLATALFRRQRPRIVDDEDPWPPACEICGGPTAVHLTEVRRRVKRQRHFCSKHAPDGLGRPTKEHELTVVEHMLAEAQARVWDDKGATLRQLKELEEYVRSGRGSVTDFFNTLNSGNSSPEDP